MIEPASVKRNRQNLPKLKLALQTLATSGEVRPEDRDLIKEILQEKITSIEISLSKRY